MTYLLYCSGSIFGLISSTFPLKMNLMHPDRNRPKGLIERFPSTFRTVALPPKPSCCKLKRHHLNKGFYLENCADFPRRWVRLLPPCFQDLGSTAGLNFPERSCRSRSKSAFLFPRYILGAPI